jgi:hypothetical protein
MSPGSPVPYSAPAVNGGYPAPATTMPGTNNGYPAPVAPSPNGTVPVPGSPATGGTFSPPTTQWNNGSSAPAGALPAGSSPGGTTFRGTADDRPANSLISSQPASNGAASADTSLLTNTPTPAIGMPVADSSTRPIGSPATSDATDVRQPFTQTLQPAARDTAGAPAAANASSANSGTGATTGSATGSLAESTVTQTNKPIDIMNLPAAGGGTAAPGSDAGGQAQAPGTTSAFRPVTGGQEAPPQGNYGFGPRYEWLRGKLEYSSVERKWKLRYVPSGSQADAYGGSVTLPSVDLLTGCQRGEFLEVRGTLRPLAGRPGSSPLYEVAEVKRLLQ